MLDISKINYLPFYLDNFNEIKISILERYKDFINNTQELSAIPVEWNKENIPLLYNSINQRFEQYGSTITRARLFLTPENFRMLPHIDGKQVTDDYWALNIPISVANSDHWHEWYYYDGPVSNTDDETYTDYIMPTDFKQVKLKDKLLVTEPHFLKIGIFHGVLNRSPVKRVMLSIRFKVANIQVFLSLLEKEYKTLCQK